MAEEAGDLLRRRGRTAAGIVGLLVSVAYTRSAYELPHGTQAEPGAAVFPIAVGLAFAAVSLLTVWEGVMGRTQHGTTMTLPRGADRARVLAVLASLVAFVLFVPTLGFLLTATIVLAVLRKTLHTAGWPRVLLEAALASVLLYVGFSEVLGVPLPWGTLFPRIS